MSEISNTDQALQPRHIGAINWVGLHTLVKREVGRFINVYTQTVVAPVITTLLFYTVFALAFGGIQREINGIPYMHFLAPGLIMMGILQNAFANTSSSVVISKVQGNIVDVLMPPLSALELFIGYVSGGMLRGILVGTVTCITVALFVGVTIQSFAVVVVFGVLGSMMMGSLGLAAGIWSEKFDHIAAVTNFVVTPLTFLSGTFYTVGQLPSMWQAMAYYNPFFYVIDGFRSGFIGQADGHLWIGIGILVGVNVALMALNLWMIRSGYKIKS